MDTFPTPGLLWFWPERVLLNNLYATNFNLPRIWLILEKRINEKCNIFHLAPSSLSKSTSDMFCLYSAYRHMDHSLDFFPQHQGSPEEDCLYGWLRFPSLCLSVGERSLPWSAAFVHAGFSQNFFFENHILIWMRITIILVGDCCECDSQKGGLGNNAWRPLWPGGRQVTKV